MKIEEVPAILDEARKGLSEFCKIASGVRDPSVLPVIQTLMSHVGLIREGIGGGGAKLIRAKSFVDDVIKKRPTADYAVADLEQAAESLNFVLENLNVLINLPTLRVYKSSLSEIKRAITNCYNTILFAITGIRNRSKEWQFLWAPQGR